MAEYRRVEDMTLFDAKARAALIARASNRHALTYSERAAVLLLDEIERLEAIVAGARAAPKAREEAEAP